MHKNPLQLDEIEESATPDYASLSANPTPKPQEVRHMKNQMSFGNT